MVISVLTLEEMTFAAVSVFAANVPEQQQLAITILKKFVYLYLVINAN